MLVLRTRRLLRLHDLTRSAAPHCSDTWRLRHLLLRRLVLVLVLVLRTRRLLRLHDLTRLLVVLLMKPPRLVLMPLMPNQLPPRDLGLACRDAQRLRMLLLPPGCAHWH